MAEPNAVAKGAPKLRARQEDDVIKMHPLVFELNDAVAEFELELLRDAIDAKRQRQGGETPAIVDSTKARARAERVKRILREEIAASSTRSAAASGVANG